jgi:hypothetical protein
VSFEVFAAKGRGMSERRFVEELERIVSPILQRMTAQERAERLQKVNDYLASLETNPPKWTALLVDCAAMKVGESFSLEISPKIINRFRAILRVSGRTSRWRWSVRKISDHVWRVKKVGRW